MKGERRRGSVMLSLFMLREITHKSDGRAGFLDVVCARGDLRKMRQLRFISF